VLIGLLHHQILCASSMVPATSLLIFADKSGCSDWDLKLKN